MVGFGRNKSLVEKSFFTERFTPELIQTLNECGVKLGIHHPILRLFGRMSSYIGLGATFPPLNCEKPQIEAFKGILVHFKGSILGAEGVSHCLKYSRHGDFSCEFSLAQAAVHGPWSKVH